MVGNRPTLDLPSTYHEKTVLPILAIAVKPFGYRRKVFRLQPQGCRKPPCSLYARHFAPLHAVGSTCKDYLNEPKVPPVSNKVRLFANCQTYQFLKQRGWHGVYKQEKHYVAPVFV